MSRKLTLATNATTGEVTIASQAEATFADVLTTIPSTTEVVTGSLGLVQRLAIFEAGNIVGGMVAGSSFVQAATFGMAGN